MVLRFAGSDRSSLRLLLGAWCSCFLRICWGITPRQTATGTSICIMGRSGLRPHFDSCPLFVWTPVFHPAICRTIRRHGTIAFNIGFGKQGSSYQEIEVAARSRHLSILKRGSPPELKSVVPEPACCTKPAMFTSKAMPLRVFGLNRAIRQKPRSPKSMNSGLFVCHLSNSLLRPCESKLTNPSSPGLLRMFEKLYLSASFRHPSTIQIIS